MVGVILAAGNGSRLKNSSNSDVCKPLVVLHRKQLIEYALENLRLLQIDRACIVVGKEGALIRQALGTQYKGIQLCYACQSSPRGLIHAFIQAIHVLGCEETIALQLCDEIFIGLKAEAIRAVAAAETYDFCCGFTREENPEKIKGNYSVDVDAQFLIRKCVEKPTLVTNDRKGTGFCLFSPRALQLLRSRYHEEENVPGDLCDYANWLIAQERKGLALLIAEREFNINTSADFLEAEAYLQQWEIFQL